MKDLHAKKTKDGAFKLTKESQDKVMKFLSKIKAGEDFILKILLPSEMRSYQQLKLYWKAIIPALTYYDDDFIYCVQDAESAHYQAKLFYCAEKRPDLIEVLKFKDPRTGKQQERAIPFSAKLSEMKQKDFNDYLDYLKTRIATKAGINFEKAIQEVL